MNLSEQRASILAQAPAIRPRKHLGWLLDFYAVTESKYLGHLEVEEIDQAIGSENAREIILTEDLEINRSFSKKRILKAGTKVRRIVSPLQGKQL